MARKIMLVQGHPDVAETHYCHALENAYVDGARASGHEVQVIRIAELQFPLLRSAAAFSGISPVRETLIGMVATPNPRGRERWLERVRQLGRRAA